VPGPLARIECALFVDFNSTGGGGRPVGREHKVRNRTFQRLLQCGLLAFTQPIEGLAALHEATLHDNHCPRQVQYSTRQVKDPPSHWQSRD